jgi:hypothetical protein
VITIQRVRVRWSAAARAAPQANARRGLCRASNLPSSLPSGPVVIHDVLADEATGYVRQESVSDGDIERARDIGLWLVLEGSTLVAERLPGWAAYPRQSGSARLFKLMPGQMGQYRANFRFTGCACDPSWYYEDWLIRICNGDIQAEQFPQRQPTHDLDHRVHLYGGSKRRADGAHRL